MKAPHVLVCAATLAQPMSGVRRHNAELLRRVHALLAKRGGGITLLAGRAELPREIAGELEVLPSSIPASPVVARVALESRELRRVLRSRTFDLVHTDHLPAPRALSVPFTLTLHDLKSVSSAHEALARRLIGKRVLADAISRAATVFAVSRTLQGEIAQLFDAPAAKLAIVPNGCDHLPLLPRAREEFALFVGHVEPRKNLEVVLRALALDRGLPALRIAGAAKGAHERGLRDLARELGVEARVRWLGLQSDDELARLYATCACFVAPSAREGFDIPLAEAMRAGAPIAMSSLPVHRELAPGAAHFDPRDAAACAAAIRRAAPHAAGHLATWDDAARAWCDALCRVSASAAAASS